MSTKHPQNILDLDLQGSVNFLIAVAEDAYKEKDFLFSYLFVEVAYELMDESELRPGTNIVMEC